MVTTSPLYTSQSKLHSCKYDMFLLSLYVCTKCDILTCFLHLQNITRICLFVGFFLSNAFLSIVEGCVSAILVCYAAAPVEFHANHPKLSEEMKMVWKYFWLQKRRDRTGGTVDGPPSRSSI